MPREIFANKRQLINRKKILVTSLWAKKEILKYYKCNPKKIKVLPFGSNLENNITFSKIKKKNLISQKKKFKSFLLVLTGIGKDLIEQSKFVI